MKKFLQISLIFILCAGLSSVSYGDSETDQSTAEGQVEALIEIAYTAEAGIDGRLDNINSQSYAKFLIGHFVVSNNDPDGYEITLKSTEADQGLLDSDASKVALASSRMVHSDYKAESSNAKHRFVEGAFIEYAVSAIPQGVTVQNAASPQNESYLNANDTNDYTANNIHGCYASSSAALDSLTQSAHDLFIIEKSLNSEESMEFNLANTPCTDRTNGVSATADYAYDLLITTVMNNKLLAGTYTDQINLIITDL